MKTTPRCKGSIPNAFPIGTIKGERLLYLPSVGWCLLLGYLVAAVPPRHARAAVMAVTALIVLFGARTWTRNGDWTNDATLFAATVATSPSSAKANHNSAVILQRAGRLDDAMLHYRRALEIDNRQPEAQYNLGYVMLERGEPESSIPLFHGAIEADPKFSDAYFNLAMAYEQVGETQKARPFWKNYISLEPSGTWTEIARRHL